MNTKYDVVFSRSLINPRTAIITSTDPEEFGWIGTKGHRLISEGSHLFSFQREDKHGRDSGVITAFRHINIEQMTGILTRVSIVVHKRKLQAISDKMVAQFKAEVEAQYAKERPIENSFQAVASG